MLSLEMFFFFINMKQYTATHLLGHLDLLLFGKHNVIRTRLPKSNTFW